MELSKQQRILALYERIYKHQAKLQKYKKKFENSRIKLEKLVNRIKTYLNPEYIVY